jgi:membrane protein implicated in regulation of membrane protease activity
MARRFGRSDREELVASLPPVWHVGFAITTSVFMFLVLVSTLLASLLFLMAGIVSVLARMVWLARVDRSGSFRRRGFALVHVPWSGVTR